MIFRRNFKITLSLFRIILLLFNIIIEREETMKKIKLYNIENITVEEAFEEFIDSKISLKKSPETIEYYRNVFKTFR